ncbi:2910_t:CDS:2 [Scutellospora calospora]|uniref:2910_t:CDS:1 n=1 Tax=Scutellospora calospora TaxID=85575 RepID=A0ACA9JY86_9GLOM|nr:2910_t:CDS:2 [Scutellospora calospora]
MFSSNRRKSTSAKSVIVPQTKGNYPSAKKISSTTTKTPSLNVPNQEHVTEDDKPPNAMVTKTTTTTTVTTVTTTTVSPKDLDTDCADLNLNRNSHKSQDNIQNCPSSSTVKPTTSSEDTWDEANDSSSTLKPSTVNKIPIKPSSLPIKINNSSHDEPSSSSNPKNDPITSSSTKPQSSSLIEKKSHRNRSSTIFNSNSTIEPKITSIRSSMISGVSPTKLPRTHKRTGSAPILNGLSMPINNNINKISLAKSMINLNNTFEAKIDRETPKQYLERMMYSVSRSKLVTILTQKADVFHQSALKAYMKLFEFEKVPIDLALRKLLMECNLPKETQHIDRVIEAFAKSYHESNPDLFPSADTPYMLAFSLLMLHTDVYNKNVKQKMTKEEFVKNTRIDGVNPEILEILYDNITYTQFIYAQDDTDVNGQTMLGSPTHRQIKLFSSKDRKKSIRFKNDPYWVIQTKLPTEFKPKIKDIIPTENPYSYMGTLPALDITNLYRVFSTTNTIKITGVKNRRNSHTSFKDTSNSNKSTNNDDDGTFLLNITKSGKLGRKVDLIDGKRRNSFIRNWKIYGVILSGSQLMFFKDETMFNVQMKRLNNYKDSSSISPVLKPDAILMTADSVAVYDKNYDKHKNVFRLVCPKGHQYLFKAENEEEMNDWISKINYAAAFKTAGLKMRNIRNPNIGQLRRGVGTSNFKLGMFGYSHDDAAKEAQGRTNLIRSKINELQGKISALTSQLQADIRFRNNLFLMIPYKASTRDRILKVATLVGSRLKHTCLELSKLVCYNEILEKDLCSTVMEDKTYWQNRRSYFTPGDNLIDDDNNPLIISTNTNLSSKSLSVPETFGKLFIKEPISNNNKLLDPTERINETNTRPATMGSFLRSSTSSLSLNSSTGESSRTSLSTSGDSEEGYDYPGNISEYEMDDRDDYSFRDDASSIIALDDYKEQFSLNNEIENGDYNSNLYDVESNYDGKNSEGIEIRVTKFTEVTSNENDEKFENEKSIIKKNSKDQFQIKRTQLNLESVNSSIGLMSNNLSIPVLVISTVEDELSTEDKISDDFSDHFVDAEEYSRSFI